MIIKLICYPFASISVLSFGKKRITRRERKGRVTTFFDLYSPVFPLSTCKYVCDQTDSKKKKETKCLSCTPPFIAKLAYPPSTCVLKWASLTFIRKNNNNQTKSNNSTTTKKKNVTCESAYRLTGSCPTPLAILYFDPRWANEVPMNGIGADSSSRRSIL